ncbi:hypothetical protein AAEX37_01108 [Oligella sp. MSHR50489EDL]|uniref:hypothetical protein n=1 Tax=Oligella sp. MSHR50489EDL TaxID=3139409 RepID=UPI003D81AB99
MESRTKKLLDYWQRLVEFNPVSLKTQKYDPTDQNCNKLQENAKFISVPLRPKSALEADYYQTLIATRPKSKHIHLEMVVGQISHIALYNLINQQLPANQQIEIVDNDQDSSFFFYLRLDADGHYVQDSFQISKFIHAMCNMIQDDLDEPQEIAEKIPAKLLPKDVAIEPQHLEKLIDYILDKLKIQHWKDQLCIDEYSKEDWQILITLFNSKNKQQEAIMQLDFYSKDLAVLKKEDLSKHYIEKLILARPINEPKQIDDNLSFLTEITSPQNHSAGKWPSKHNPSLMQKVAINIATDPNAPKVFSVNGPPGTGKTTLLKEVVANAIVEKAKILYQLGSNSANHSVSFKKKMTKSVTNSDPSYYELPKELKQHSIIVASNNNSAVENITKELPHAKDLTSDNTYTDLFDIQKHQEIYFTKAAEELFNDGGESVFGLIAAPFGKKPNIEKILKVLPQTDDEFEDFKYGLEQKPNLEMARAAFKEALDRFESIKNRIGSEVKSFKDLDKDSLCQDSCHPLNLNQESGKDTIYGSLFTRA